MRCPRFVTLAAVVAFAAAPGIGAALAPAWLPVRLEQYVTQHVKLSPVQRTGLLQGQAVTRLLPVAWYETPNIHHLTIADFHALVAERGIRVERAWFLSGDRQRGAAGANLCAEHAVFLVSR